MPKPIDFDTMTDRCIGAAEAVMKVGSSDLQAAMRVVLTILGREIAEGLSEPMLAKMDRPPARRYVN